MPAAPSLCLGKDWGSLTGLVLIAWEGSNTFPREYHPVESSKERNGFMDYKALRQKVKQKTSIILQEEKTRRD